MGSKIINRTAVAASFFKEVHKQFFKILVLMNVMSSIFLLGYLASITTDASLYNASILMINIFFVFLLIWLVSQLLDLVTSTLTRVLIKKEQERVYKDLGIC